jgi:hypothetical protein
MDARCDVRILVYERAIQRLSTVASDAKTSSGATLGRARRIAAARALSSRCSPWAATPEKSKLRCVDFRVHLELLRDLVE